MEVSIDELDYGDIVPGVTCPECGGELVATSSGALCDWCQRYVPIVNSALVVDEGQDEEDGEYDEWWRWPFGWHPE